MEEKMIKDFIKYLVENNDYYELVKIEYGKDDDENYYINTIYKLYKNFNAYYSIYTILDTIEDYLQEDKKNNICRNIYEIIDDEDFEIRDYWR